MEDNSIVARRLLIRQRQGTLPNTLGDYPADLPNRVLVTKGTVEQGPLDSPTVAKSQDDMLTQIRDLLARMPEALSNEFRTRFIVQPRESISFIAPGSVLAVAPGTAVAVVSQLIDEQFTGFLTHVGVDVIPGALGFPDILWQIRVNGSIHPKFFNRVFSTTTLATPTPFALELTQNRTVQLVAINNGAVVRDVYGVLVGWTEFMSTNKTYGSAPSAGIA